MEKTILKFVQPDGNRALFRRCSDKELDQFYNDADNLEAATEGEVFEGISTEAPSVGVTYYPKHGDAFELVSDVNGMSQVTKVDGDGTAWLGVSSWFLTASEWDAANVEHLRVRKDGSAYTNHTVRLTGLAAEAAVENILEKFDQNGGQLGVKELCDLVALYVPIKPVGARGRIGTLRNRGMLEIVSHEEGRNGKIYLGSTDLRAAVKALLKIK